MSNNSAPKVVDDLQTVLADTYFLYLKTQNYHWNVTGPNFQSLHLLFEQQYSELALAIDTIAERIRSLGTFASGSFTEFRSNSDLEEETGHPSAGDMLANLAADNQWIAEQIAGFLANAENNRDIGTVELLAARVSVHEKAGWMLKASAG